MIRRELLDARKALRSVRRDSFGGPSKKKQRGELRLASVRALFTPALWT